MKKNFIYALLGAIALTGAAGFTSCSSTDDVGEVNPNFDAEKNTVNTQFVLNVATSEKTSTRSGATTVQANGNFRGMEKVKLFAFATNTKKAVQKDNAFVAHYDLDKLLAAGAINATNSNRVVNINIPVGTDAFLFYGKANKTPNADEEEGKIVFDVATTADSKLDPKFTLQPRLTSSNKLEKTEALVAEILNAILDVSINYTPDGGTVTAMTLESLGDKYDTEKSLAVASRTLTPLEYNLGEAYSKVKTLGTDELRAGSSDAIITMVTDLYNTFNTVSSAIPTGTQETAAHDLAATAKSKIADYFVTPSPTTTQITFNPVASLETKITNWTTNGYNVVTDDYLKGFPQCFGLPAGASLLSINSTTKKFEYKNSTTLTGNLIDQAANTRDKIMYPAELTYYCNGPIRTTNQERLVADYPNGTATWETDGSWTAGGWSSNASTVTSSTRAAALIPNVNYGVAMLKSIVKLNSTAADGKFVDNRHANTGEDNDTFNKTELNFDLIGILIGGQCNTVGWDFLRSSTSDNFDYMVYDNRIAGQNAGSGTNVPTTDGASTTPNYTLLFDNYVCGATLDAAGTVDGQNDVLVALEFKNNGDGFWGKGNYIPTGGTFYLMGKLTKPTSSQSTGFSWPGTTDGSVDRYYEVPPIDNNGSSRKIARVFVQDYVTEATFTIGATSLQNAYVTVPDLRSTQMSFGLSVDLTWKTGLTYNDVILGQ